VEVLKAQIESLVSQLSKAREKQQSLKANSEQMLEVENQMLKEQVLKLEEEKASIS